MNSLKKTSINKYEYNFESLPQKTKDTIRDLILEAEESRGSVDGYKRGEECIDEIEFKSRDGFIANSDNFGGIVSRNFATLSDFWSSGNSCAHKKAAKEIERQIDYSLECAKESFIESYPEFKDADVSYHSLYESGELDLAEEFSNLEVESMSDESSSIMFEFRFMYHGFDGVTHRASVSAAINTEGPYHRSSISWAKDVFCEGASEVEITWTTDKELKAKLKDALNKVSNEIF